MKIDGGDARLAQFAPGEPLEQWSTPSRPLPLRWSSLICAASNQTLPRIAVSRAVSTPWLGFIVLHCAAGPRCAAAALRGIAWRLIRPCPRRAAPAPPWLMVSLTMGTIPHFASLRSYPRVLPS